MLINFMTYEYIYTTENLKYLIKSMPNRNFFKLKLTLTLKPTTQDLVY